LVYLKEDSKSSKYSISGRRENIMQPIVSVIMPAYNAEQYILESIYSVKSQTETRWELLIVDDCSTDSTTALVKREIESDNRIRLFEMKENRGPSFTRNVGIEKAGSEFIAFLDADDLLSPTALSERILALEKHSMACGSYCDMILINDTGALFGHSFFNYQTVNFIDLAENKFPTSNTMLRKSLLKTEGSFDPDIWFGEDWDLWLRFTRTGRYFVKAGGCIVYYRQYPKSLTHNSITRDNEQRMTVMDRAWDCDPNSRNPLQEFKNGLGDAIKTSLRIKRAFPVAITEAAKGNEQNAKQVMEHVSVDVLLLLDHIDIAEKCRFLIKRNLCIDEKNWYQEIIKIKPKIEKFLSGYYKPGSEIFFGPFLNKLFQSQARRVFNILTNPFSGIWNLFYKAMTLYLSDYMSSRYIKKLERQADLARNR
jgi:teichuronic acid biosynthesis glycosyltransferase TuaG